MFSQEIVSHKIRSLKHYEIHTPQIRNGQGHGTTEVRTSPTIAGRRAHSLVRPPSRFFTRKEGPSPLLAVYLPTRP